MSAHNFDGVIGSSLIRIPSGASASLTAFAMTAGTVIDEDSPSPFEPSGVRGDGDTMCAMSICGASLAVLVVGELFVERAAEPVERAAVDLPRGDHGVDDRAGVVHGHVAEDLDRR